MKNTRTEFRFFTIMDWEKEQNYLRQRQQEGWKFVKVNFFGLYHFERCEPEDVIYQLDYNPEGIAHKDEYVQMFRDCGWEYLQDYVGYSYFRKPASEMDGEEEIFCDDDSRADMMRRIFSGRMVPLLVILFLLILPNIYLQSQSNTLEGYLMTGLFVLLLVIYVSLFIEFGMRYRKFSKSLHR